MMQKRSKLFVANIVLGIVLGVLVCISIIVMVILHVAFDEVEREYDSYDWDDYYGGSQNYDDSWSYDYDDWDYDDSWNYEDGWDYDDSWTYDEEWDYGNGVYDSSAYYTIPSILGATAELIGPSYQEGEAEEGYQFYRLTMQVHNAGTDYMMADYLDLEVSGEEYSDVYLYREQPYSEEMDNFAYSNLKLIPSGQTATVSVVIEVKDTVEDVTIEIYPDYGGTEMATYVLNLK